jgi:hypothetical protein
MDKPREPITTNLLPDGNVLIMGGKNKSIDTAEIFDSKQMKLFKSIPLNDRRFSGYTATSLQNGDVYIAGGYLYQEKGMPKLTNTAKIFDAKTYSFKDAKMLPSSFASLAACLLKNNHILLLNTYTPKYDIHLIFNPDKNDYYKAYSDLIPAGGSFFRYKNGNVLILGVNKSLYNVQENKFEPHDDIPTEQLFIQLDGENYFTIKPEKNYTSGYTYNLKTKNKIPVSNNMDRTFYSASYSRPKLILLENGNVLILKIDLKKLPSRNLTFSSFIKKEPRIYDYSTYIFSRDKNIFYKIKNPPIKIDNNAASIMLKNGDILIAGGRNDKYGKKIQIYKYKH